MHCFPYLLPVAVIHYCCVTEHIARDVLSPNCQVTLRNVKRRTSTRACWLIPESPQQSWWKPALIAPKGKMSRQERGWNCMPRTIKAAQTVSYYCLKIKQFTERLAFPTLPSTNVTVKKKKVNIITVMNYFVAHYLNNSNEAFIREYLLT